MSVSAVIMTILVCVGVFGGAAACVIYSMKKGEQNGDL